MMPSLTSPRWLAFLSLLALGCVPEAPKLPTTDTRLPDAFAGQDGTNGRSSGLVPWSEFFGDPQLAALLREAITNNPDLPIALARVETARAYAAAATGAQLPQVGVAAGAGIRKFGLYTMDGAGNSTTDITPGRIVPEHLPNYTAGLVASWEVDVWGKLADQKRSAAAR